MLKTVLLVLVLAIAMINGEPNFACTGRGGYCSDSDTCASLGGEVDKLSVRCKSGNACCKCTGKKTCVGECLDQCGILAEDPAGGCCRLKYCGLIEHVELKKPNNMMFEDTAYVS